MKVQTKITLLLVVVVATFLVGLAAFNAYDRAKFRHIGDQRFIERNKSFEKFLIYQGQSLETLADDTTSWDQMVSAIKAGPGTPWFAENVNEDLLESYHANAIWIYAPDGTLVYHTNNLNSDDPPQFP